MNKKIKIYKLLQPIGQYSITLLLVIALLNLPYDLEALKTTLLNLGVLGFCAKFYEIIIEEQHKYKASAIFIGMLLLVFASQLSKNFENLFTFIFLAFMTLYKPSSNRTIDKSGKNKL